jgi:hypothetical protein
MRRLVPPSSPSALARSRVRAVRLCVWRALINGASRYMCLILCQCLGLARSRVNRVLLSPLFRFVAVWLWHTPTRPSPHARGLLWAGLNSEYFHLILAAIRLYGAINSSLPRVSDSTARVSLVRRFRFNFAPYTFRFSYAIRLQMMSASRRVSDIPVPIRVGPGSRFFPNSSQSRLFTHPVGPLLYYRLGLLAGRTSPVNLPKITAQKCFQDEY